MKLQTIALTTAVALSLAAVAMQIRTSSKLSDLEDELARQFSAVSKLELDSGGMSRDIGRIRRTVDKHEKQIELIKGCEKSQQELNESLKDAILFKSRTRSLHQ